MTKHTLRSILSTYPQRLEAIFGPTHRDIEDLLLYILDTPRTFLITHPDYTLSLLEWNRFKRAFKKRQQGLPLAYITKKAAFYGETFFVNQNVLIPRPETEHLVDLVSDFVKNNTIRNIIEVGTGSGALIISIAKKLKPTKIDYHYIATDISQKAIALARLNAIRHRLDINFRVRDLIKRPNTFIPLTSWVLVSNPPYVPHHNLSEPSIAHEPNLALDGGTDGLDYYNTLLQQASLLQNKPKAIFFEIGYDQAEGVHLLAQKYLGNYTSLTIHKDFAGKDRCIQIVL
jgi:release factor glutamine methyltransferase